MPQAVFISTLFCLKKCYSRSHTRVGEKKIEKDALLYTSLLSFNNYVCLFE